MTRIAAIAAAAGALAGCAAETVLVRPGAPVLVTAAEGRVRISAWDPQGAVLVDAGWVDARSLVGLTAVDYEWADAVRPAAEGELAWRSP